MAEEMVLHDEYRGVRSNFNSSALPGYVYKKAGTPMVPDYGRATYIQMHWIINSSTQNICVFPSLEHNGSDGLIGIVPPCLDSTRCNQTAEMICRNGKEVVTIRGFSYSGRNLKVFNSPREVPIGNQFECSILLDELQFCPKYIPEFNLTICLARDKHIIKQFHPLSNEFYEAARLKYLENWYNDHPEASISIEGNDPTGKITHLYTVLNGVTICTHINNHPNATPYAQIRFNSITPQTLEFDVAKVLGGLETKVCNYGTMPWILGASKTMVEAKYRDLDISSKHKYTEEDLVRRVTESSSILDDELKDVKKRLKTAHDTIKELKTNIANLELGIQNENKMRMMQLENEGHFTKQYTEQEKATNERIVSGYKVVKEHHGLRSSEIDLLTSTIKGAAIVLPILATIYIATRSKNIAFIPALKVGSVLCSAGSALWAALSGR